jgi:cysteinyl-tRNA synthetase
MRLYNTLSRQTEEFAPLTDHEVRMYVCGPTVYDYDHIGHARTYLTFDLLNRFFRFFGWKVNYVQNITDVGHLVNDAESGIDKIQQKAHETGQTVGEIVEHFTSSHLEDMESLHITPPTHNPKASESIDDIIEFISGLVNKGFAYITNQGNVYFSVQKDPQYGKLSRRGLAEILTGTRVESASDKRSSADFALWKAATAGMKEMIWDSPWGRGYPGWHIECSVMSHKLLGDTFDIHGSAVEHVFPHHENEIAQTESLTDKEMARFWVHSGMLNINGVKMSKSLHNVVTIKDALKKYSANELRLAFYLTHYRKPYDYTEKSIDQGVALRKKLFLAYSDLPKESNKSVFKEITDALTDDFDTPKALLLWGENADKLNTEDTNKLFDIFGLVYKSIEEDKEATRLSEERDAARKSGDFLTADNRKAEIEQKGYEILDKPDNTVYLPR